MAETAQDQPREVRITLPDGSVRIFAGPVTGAEIAAAIGPGLAKAALAVRVDGALWDLGRAIESDAKVAIVTAKDADGLDLLRHDTAHVMAQAVQELWPDAQVTIGPTIENGFYYDFHRAAPFTPDDLAAIEARMHAIVDRNLPVVREVWAREAARDAFLKLGETFKAELVDAIPEGEAVTVYRQGDWFDLCRGPHFDATGRVGHAFKLMSVAGAYWRGDSRNPQLQRIYGTAWFTEADLKRHLDMIAEAERRDHRRIGPAMDLFHIQEEAVGSVFWHPDGWTLYRAVQGYMRARLERAGYVEVNTPQLVDRKLWERSGHWEKFREAMFVIADEDERVLCVKPMNCPGHVQIYRHGLKSYRDLPLRMAEFGSCHRFEPSGALHGIMRVRAFTQDDAHIFCTEDQIVSETRAFCALLESVYADFGFTEIAVKFSDRPAVRAGDDATWDRAEAALKEATDAAGLAWTLNPGEGAFYGPKLEFVLRDAIGRDWQCGTFQVDFVLPERLDAEYVAEDGARKRPVMLHRAILGSFERFLGILIEQYAGRFPLWLAPVQVVVASIVDDAAAFAEEAAAELRKAGLRVDTDLRNEKINRKIVDHIDQRVPVLAVVGRREAEERSLVLRRLPGREQETVPLAEAVARLRAEATPPDQKLASA